MSDEELKIKISSLEMVLQSLMDVVLEKDLSLQQKMVEKLQSIEAEHQRYSGQIGPEQKAALGLRKFWQSKILKLKK